MKKQGIDKCMTRVAKVCTIGGYVQCMTKALKMHMWGVQGPFSVSWPHVVRWRDDLTRLGIFLGSSI